MENMTKSKSFFSPTNTNDKKKMCLKSFSKNILCGVVNTSISTSFACGFFLHSQKQTQCFDGYMYSLYNSITCDGSIVPRKKSNM